MRPSTAFDLDRPDGRRRCRPRWAWASSMRDPPPPSVPAPSFIFWIIVPLVGILWDRWCGCRGILGGALGGVAEAGFALIWVVTGPHRPGFPRWGPSFLSRTILL